jgi:hypothetical protein
MGNDHDCLQLIRSEEVRYVLTVREGLANNKESQDKLTFLQVSRKIPVLVYQNLIL